MNDVIINNTQTSIHIPKSNIFTLIEWVDGLKIDGHEITIRAEGVIRSAVLFPNSGIHYNAVFISGNEISSYRRSTSRIRTKAKTCGYLEPHWEIVCLIVDDFEEFERQGFKYIVIMHSPIYFNDTPYLLCVERSVSGQIQIGTKFGGDIESWSDNGCFIFIH